MVEAPKMTTLAELKEMRAAGQLKIGSDGHGEKHGSAFTPVPMFLPTRTFGNSVATVTTRQKFIDTNIGWWLRWRISRVAAAALAILTIVLIPYNIWIAAASAIAAGWMYGQHVWSQFYVTQLLGKRRLLETT